MRPTDGQPTTNQATGQATDHRMTVPEAAGILGVSEDAVRSRLKRGTLRKEKGQDGTVFVVMDSDGPADLSTTHDDQPMTDLTTGQAPDQAALVEVVRDQVAFLREQLNEEREANRENRRIIAGLVQRVPELEAREARPETAMQEATKGNAPASPEPKQRRSWLYRFFFGP
jgi:hypothetical protein